MRRPVGQAVPAEPEAAKRGGRRERNKREKFERIVSAARRLFREKGFADTTTQEIAEAADIGSGTLFLYAKSKEDLLVVVFKDEMLAVAAEAFTTLDRSKPLLDQLMTVFGNMITYHQRDMALSRVLIKELTVLTNPDRRRDLAELMRTIYGAIVDLVLSAQVAGQVRADVAPLHAAQFLFYTYYQVLQMWVGGWYNEARLKERLRLNLRLALQGLATRPKRPKGTAPADIDPARH